MFLLKKLANIYSLSVCLSVCLSGHVYLCFYPSVCLNIHTERNIHVHVQTDRRIHVPVQTDRRIDTKIHKSLQTYIHYIFASAFPKTGNELK